MSSTTAALRALASHVLPRVEDSRRGIGVRLDAPWTGGDLLHLGASEVPLIWCESSLAAREALVARERSSDPWFLLTPLDERELGDDVLARLFRCRLLRLDRWRILRDRLGAHRIDPRLRRHAWLADAMLEVLPQSGSKVASGFLDAATAWGILLEGYFGLREARPDLRTLLAWSRSAEASAWIVQPPAGPAGQVVSQELLDEAAAWIRESAGEAGVRIFGMARGGRARDALPLGIVMDLVFGGDSDDADLRVAAARLERFAGNKPIPVAAGENWGREAAASLRREIGSGGSGIQDLLQRAEAIAQEIDLGNATEQSRLLPSGMAGRWQSLASALQGDEVSPLEAALDELQQHELVRGPDAETAELLVRLKRWLLRRGSDVPASVPGFAAWALKDGCWVDRLRNGLRARSLPSSVEPAARGLLDEADLFREDLNRAFGQQLAGWLSTGARASEPALESERLIPEVLAPLATSGPVLLVLLDGLTSAVLLELLPAIREQGWRELAPAETPARRLLVAPLPTVTDVTRCSLLAGSLLRGAAGVEARAFSQHPKLVAASTASRPPRLFHKGALEDDAMLSPELREVLLERDQRVVGVVVNAIDEQLSGSDQISLRWTESIIRPLQSLLSVAGQAGRLVVLAGDHGHVLEHGSAFRKHSGGARWRQPTAERADDEVLLEGSRVLAGGGRIVAPWSEKIRYGGKSAGYHGGASPQEVLVPFAVFCTSEPPSGWLEIEPAPPPWWTAEEATASVRHQPAEAPRAATPAEKQPAENQLGLFTPPASPVAEPVAVPQRPSWLDQLMASEVLAQQRPLAGRAGVDEDLMQKLLIALERRGGRVTRPALAQSLDYPAGRLRGFLALVQKLLNVEGYPVLEIEEASATVTLNRELLVTQFELNP